MKIYLKMFIWDRLIVIWAVACFALSSTTRAVEPPPDGGYPGQNTAEGEDALFNLTTGVDNAAIGFNALFNNTSGYANTATGERALSSNINGFQNTAAGANALLNNISGGGNTAVGYDALYVTTGDNNTAIGSYALFFNSTGDSNTAVGRFAMDGNQTGNLNTAIGGTALANNTSGSNNTAIGVDALFRNQAGSDNIAVGYSAGYAVRGSNNIEIGNAGVPDDASHIRIGTKGVHLHTTVAGIYGVFGGDGIPVLVNSNGRLGTATSSARFKEAIEPMANSSEAILSLKPVSFRYKNELDSKGTLQFGLVAEEVEKVAPELVSHDEQGQPYTVRYEAVNAMLLNEFLKEHRKVEQLEKKIEALAASLQRVSAQVETRKLTAQVALKDE